MHLKRKHIVNIEERLFFITICYLTFYKFFSDSGIKFEILVSVDSEEKRNVFPGKAYTYY